MSKFYEEGAIQNEIMITLQDKRLQSAVPITIDGEFSFEKGLYKASPCVQYILFQIHFSGNQDRIFFNMNINTQKNKRTIPHAVFTKNRDFVKVTL